MSKNEVPSETAYKASVLFVFVFVGLFLIISLSSCSTSKHGIQWDERTGEAFYYGIPPFDTLKAHFGQDFDCIKIKRVLVFDQDSKKWEDVPMSSQLRPIPISQGKWQEVISFHLYHFSEYGDVTGIYNATILYERVR